MSPKIARLAGLGAFGACGFFVVLYLFVAYISRHNPPFGGMTVALAAVTWISLALVTIALIAFHVAIGKQLLAVAEGRATGV